MSSEEATGADGQEFEFFSDSMLHRLGQVLRERDRLLQLLAVAPDGIAVGHFAGDALDTILLLSLAAVDAAAEAVNMIFALGIERPMWGSDIFVSNLCAKCQGLADLFTENTGGAHYCVWKSLAELRNSIHSEAISQTPTIFVVHDFPGRVLLPIPPTRFRKVKDHFLAMGGLERWGVFENVPGSNRAHLHPGEFLEALLPRVFALVHRIMVETLEGMGVPASPTHGNRYGRPLSGHEADSLALLGIVRVDY